MRYIHANRHAYNYIIGYQGFCLEAAKAELLDWSQTFLSEFKAYSLDPSIRQLTYWINKSVPVEIVRDGISRATIAFKNKWKNKKGYPRFKKYADNKSFSFSSHLKIFQQGRKNYIKIPGRLHIEIESHKTISPLAKLRKATISHEVDQWFASVTYEAGEIPAPYVPTSAIAIDEGLTSLITLSTGDKISSPKPLKAASFRVKRLQRQLSRSQKGSKRREKKKIRLAKAHRKVRRIREYHGKYVANRITELAKKNNSALVWQDINISGIMKNHHLAGAFADSGISQIKIWMTQMASRKGIPIHQVPRFEKTSGLCPLCGTRHKLQLKDREFICCGIRHDRDIAAAQHMEKIWLENNQTPMGSIGAGRGTGEISRQSRGLPPDRRLGLLPLATRNVPMQSNEPSNESTTPNRLTDAAHRCNEHKF